MWGLLASLRAADAEQLAAVPITHCAIIDRINDSAEASLLRGTANERQTEQ